MAFSANKKGKIFSEINITPLTDIFLVLLIIMMVVAPAFQSMDNAVEVPEILKKQKLRYQLQKMAQCMLMAKEFLQIN